MHQLFRQLTIFIKKGLLQAVKLVLWLLVPRNHSKGKKSVNWNQFRTFLMSCPCFRGKLVLLKRYLVRFLIEFLKQIEHLNASEINRACCVSQIEYEKKVQNEIECVGCSSKLILFMKEVLQQAYKNRRPYRFEDLIINYDFTLSINEQKKSDPSELSSVLTKNITGIQNLNSLNEIFTKENDEVALSMSKNKRCILHS